MRRYLHIDFRGLKYVKKIKHTDNEKGVVSVELAIIAGLVVFLAAVVGALIFFQIRSASETARTPDQLYGFSPPQYCLSQNLGTSAAVIQNLVSEGNLPIVENTLYQFNISADLYERDWNSDFNFDGDINDVIRRTPTNNNHGFSISMVGEARGANATHIPSNGISFSGSAPTPSTLTENGANTTLYSPQFAGENSTFIVPSAIWEAHYQQRTNGDGIRYDIRYGFRLPIANDVLRQERLRTLLAVPVPASELSLSGGNRAPSAVRTIDADRLEFGAEIVVNRAEQCWTLRILE